jgi:cytochrome c peroxidase
MRNSIFLFLFAMSCIASVAFRFEKTPKVISIQTPKKWPSPMYDFSKNPLTEIGFELGRKLFYDPILSRDSSISCASCHLQYTGFTHVDHAVSHGIDGRKGTRNTLALMNLAWQKSFHWDGGVTNLEAQAINPLQHPAEMDNSLSAVIKRLNASSIYPGLFEKAFGKKEITTSKLLKALTQFTVSLISANSKYDKVSRKERGIFFTEQEKRGLKLFNANCNSCHTAPLFTNTFFANNGLKIDTLLNDTGRFAITGFPRDSLNFKIPSLRNIEFTFPYMHDGRFKKLKDVIHFYSEGINLQSPYLSPHLKNRKHFTEIEKKDLLAFLYTLTDKEFLYNPRFSFPK